VEQASVTPPKPEPAVPIKQSMRADHLTCLGLREAVLDAEATSEDRSSTDAAGIPAALGTASIVPDGCTFLCKNAIDPGEDNWAGKEEYRDAKEGRKEDDCMAVIGHLTVHLRFQRDQIPPQLRDFFHNPQFTVIVASISLSAAAASRRAQLVIKRAGQTRGTPTASASSSLAARAAAAAAGEEAGHPSQCGPAGQGDGETKPARTRKGRGCPSRNAGGEEQLSMATRSAGLPG
jgi:hypothetical protein